MKNTPKYTISFTILCIVSVIVFAYIHINTENFWIFLPGISIFYIIVCYPLIRKDFQMLSLKQLLIAILLGILFYTLFLFGNLLLSVFFSDWTKTQITLLYTTLQPVTLQNWIFLFLLVIPAEEILWRGLIQSYFQAQNFKKQMAIGYATFLYCLPLFFSVSPLLILAGCIGGIFWGYLYIQTKNLWFPLISHWIFDLLLLLLFPLEIKQ